LSRSPSEANLGNISAGGEIDLALIPDPDTDRHRFVARHKSLGPSPTRALAKWLRSPRNLQPRLSPGFFLLEAPDDRGAQAHSQAVHATGDQDKIRLTTTYSAARATLRHMVRHKHSSDVRKYPWRSDRFLLVLAFVLIGANLLFFR
jgi:hypothetical protein